MELSNKEIANLFAKGNKEIADVMEKTMGKVIEDVKLIAKQFKIIQSIAIQIFKVVEESIALSLLVNNYQTLLNLQKLGRCQQL